MSGAYKKGRGRYTSAGYAYHSSEENDMRGNDLYIRQDQEGFTRELIRDNNRVGYGADALDDDGLPFSFFIDEAERSERSAQQTRERKANKQTVHKKTLEERSFIERFERAVRRERRAAAVCGVLIALNFILLAFYGQAVIDGVRKRDQILMYENGASAYQAEIDAAKRTIEAATEGSLIRNKAQNELGMLRSERVATQTIYIQTSGLADAGPDLQHAQQEKRGLLDWLLSVADIFDFRS